MTDPIVPLDFPDLELEVRLWQRRNWPDPTEVDVVLAVTKVAEEAGELVGALTKYHEGRRGPEEILAELGDVVIAAIGAASRLENLLDLDVSLEDLAIERWRDVGARDYREARS